MVNGSEKREMKSRRNRLNILSMLILLAMFAFCFERTACYFSRMGIVKGVTVSTGRVSIYIFNTDIRDTLEVSNDMERTVAVVNNGTFPLRYSFEKISESNDCQFLKIKVISKEGNLNIGETKNMGISYSISDNTFTTINCLVRTDLILWQDIFASPSKGFSTEKILEFYIIKDDFSTKIP